MSRASGILNGFILVVYCPSTKRFLSINGFHETTIAEYSPKGTVPKEYYEDTENFRVSNDKYVMKIDKSRSCIDFLKAALKTDDIREFYHKEDTLDNILLRCMHRKFAKVTKMSFEDFPVREMKIFDCPYLGNRRVFFCYVDGEFDFPQPMQWRSQKDFKDHKKECKWSIYKTLTHLNTRIEPNPIV